MSNERRHELEKNELAILLDRANKAIEPYSTVIAIGAGALFIAAIGWLFYSSEQQGDRSVATMELIQGAASQDPEVLMEVSEDYPDTVAAAWAKLYQGQLQLSQGIQTLYSDREEAAQLLNDAIAAFDAAIAGDSDQLLLSRAYLGIGKANESLGQFEEAKAAYDQVVAIGESDAVIKQAKQRIDALDNVETQEFLAWFQDQNFAPADPSLPPSMPSIDTLPDLPELSLSQPFGSDSDDDDDALDLDAPGGDDEDSPDEEAAPEPAADNDEGDE